MQLKYYKNLDGVRAIAILMVMLFHFFHGIILDTEFLQFMNRVFILGQTGVTLFFVLSGFLITRILLFTKNNPHYFKNFYLRRTLRIFPLYYLFLFLFYLFHPLIFGSQPVPFHEQLYFYIYLQNFAETFHWQAVGPGHFWSLAVEEHFYLFWPLIVYQLNDKHLLRIIIMIIIGALLLRVFMLLNGYEVYFFTFTRIDSLAIGALLSVLERRNVFTQQNAIKFLGLTLVILIPTVLSWVLLAGEESQLIQVYKYLLFSFSYFAAIGFVISVKSGNILNKVLQSSLFTYTGRISYGLYVYHPIIYLICRRFLYTQVWYIDMVIWFSLSYLVAIISFHTFETYFLGLKNYFKYSSPKPKITPSA